MDYKKSRLKSERLKKFESELQDLEKWVSLGLVPKKELLKHEEEIKSLRKKIKEETERLLFLKDHGDTDGYVAPKRNTTKASYELGPDDMGQNDLSGSSAPAPARNNESEEEEEVDEEDSEDDSEDDSQDDEDDSYDGKNRWGREGILDPDSDDW